MNNCVFLDGIKLYDTFVTGAANLRKYAKEVNSLNVFPIPDGDTGDNMLMTMAGGINNIEMKNISEAARSISDGMLLSARGNSGVILSQFFYGLAEGLTNIEKADCIQLGNAFKKGVECAYKAVLQPVEGTVLTVMRDGVNYACSCKCDNIIDFFDCFIKEAVLSLKRTQNLLPVLEKAGVVDSGGAGFVYIIEGMFKALSCESLELDGFDSSDLFELNKKQEDINIELFTQNSLLEYGYCTELLLRLQSSKTDADNFNVSILTDYLQNVGDSVAAFKTGSAVKIHVHTMQPGKVLDFCQSYGEFLKVKIENMSLQHNNTSQIQQEKKEYGIVAVASGEGIKSNFLNMGADIVVDGGQSMNPSAEDFIKAFETVNAECTIVFPNNSNVILAARQAAAIYGKEVRVIESRTIGEGYAALSMLDTDIDNIDEMISNLENAMNDVVTAQISCCVRNAEMDGISLKCGEYIGFENKKILAHGMSRAEVVKNTAKNMDFENHYIGIIIRGADSDENEMHDICDYLKSEYPFVEFYDINGEQEIYSYILIAE